MIGKSVAAKHIEELESSLLLCGTSTVIEPSESTLTLETLTSLVDCLPAPVSDRIFVVTEGYWPLRVVSLDKENGKHFILNEHAFGELRSAYRKQDIHQPKCAENTHLSGVKIEYITAKDAAQMVYENTEISKTEYF